MTWTSSRPTVPGFYWFRPKNKPARIVNVTPKTIDSFYGPEAEWAGPLPVPEEPSPPLTKEERGQIIREELNHG